MNDHLNNRREPVQLTREQRIEWQGEDKEELILWQEVVGTLEVVTWENKELLAIVDGATLVVTGADESRLEELIGERVGVLRTDDSYRVRKVEE